MTGRARTSDYGNQFIGIYGACNDKLALIGINCSPKLERACKDALAADVIRLSISSSGLIGIYCALNSNGAIVPSTIEQSELKLLKKMGLRTHKVKGRFTACGNNVLANDKGAVVNPRIPRSEVKKISECLGVEAVQMKIADYNTVGAICEATNSGFLAHTRTSEEELEKLKSILKVQGAIGTANMGIPFLGLCIIANSRGYVVGEKTTGFELGRLEEGLGFID